MGKAIHLKDSWGTSPLAFNWAIAQSTAFQGNTTTTNIGSTNATASPGSFTAGDLLIAGLQLFNDTTDTIVKPTGWTRIGTQQTNSNPGVIEFYWKTAGASETGSYTFSWTNSATPTWMLASYVGNPVIDDSAVGAGGTSSPGTMVASSISPTGSADILLTMFFGGNTVAAATPPAGTNVRFNSQMVSGAPFYGMIVDQTLSASGATGSVTATAVTAFQQYSWLNLAMKQ